jgi:phage baseplate assembly protein V
MDFTSDSIFPRDNTGRDAQVRNMFRNGKVIEQIINDTGVFVRVQQLDKDGLISRPLPVKQFGSRSNQSFWCPNIGDDVAITMLPNSEGGEGFVDGSFYNTGNRPPIIKLEDAAHKHVTFGDGTIVEYRPRDSTLHVTAGQNVGRSGIKTMTIVVNTGGPVNIVAGTVNITASTITLTGPVKVNGDLNVSGNIDNGGDMHTTGVHTDSIGRHDA